MRAGRDLGERVIIFKRPAHLKYTVSARKRARFARPERHYAKNGASALVIRARSVRKTHDGDGGDVGGGVVSCARPADKSPRSFYRVRLEAASYAREHNPASILSAAIGREFFIVGTKCAAIGRTRGNNLWAFSRALGGFPCAQTVPLTLCAAQVSRLSPDARRIVIMRYCIASLISHRDLNINPRSTALPAALRAMAKDSLAKCAGKCRVPLGFTAIGRARSCSEMRVA